VGAPTRSNLIVRIDYIERTTRQAFLLSF